MSDIIEMQVIDESPVEMAVDFSGEFVSGADSGLYDKGYADGYEAGNIINPNWTNFSYLCSSRPDIIPHLKYSDTSNCTEFIYMFANISSSIAKNVIVPSIDTRKGKNFTNMFIYSSGIVEIGLLDLSSATQVNNMFATCTNLERISFAKECIKLSISLSNSSKLDNNSIGNIINGLADLTGQTSQKLDFHSDIIAKLTDEQWVAIYSKNWEVV